MTTPFDLIAAGNLASLKEQLAAEPGLATERHASGASLIAFAAYMGNGEAIATIRPLLARLDPYEAIILGDSGSLEAALAEGWDANTLAQDGFTPLALAAFFGNEAAFDRLLPLTTDLDQRAENPQRVAAIHAATARRNARMVEALLRAGADPDLPQQDGFTPLVAAAQHGDAQIAGLLLLFGADRTLTTADGMTAAQQATKAGHHWLAARLG